MELRAEKPFEMHVQYHCRLNSGAFYRCQRARGCAVNLSMQCVTHVSQHLGCHLHREEDVDIPGLFNVMAKV